MDANAFIQTMAAAVKPGEIFFSGEGWWLRAQDFDAESFALGLTGPLKGNWQRIGQENALALNKGWNWLPDLDEPLVFSLPPTSTTSIILSNSGLHVLGDKFAIEIETGIYKTSISRGYYCPNWKAVAYKEEDGSRTFCLFEVKANHA